MLPAVHLRALQPRGEPGSAGRAHPGDPAAHRSVAPQRHRPLAARGAHDHDRLRRAAGRRRAPARRRSPGATSRSRSPCAGSWREGTVPADLLADSVAAVSVGIVDGEPRARPLLRRGRRRRGRLQRRDDRAAATSSRYKAPPRARRSRAPHLGAMLDLAAAGVTQLTELQHRALGRLRRRSMAFPDRLAIASHNTAQAPGARSHLRRLARRLGHGREPRPGGVPRRRGDRRLLPRERSA